MNSAAPVYTIARWKKPRRTAFKIQNHGSTRADQWNLLEASTAAQLAPGTAILFFQRGFFGLVWFEGSTRRVRDLKNW